MSKILTVANREYAAAVKTKAFLVSLLLMPLLMFGGIAVQRKTQTMVDASTYRVAIVDRTPGGQLGQAIVAAAAVRNASGRTDAKTGAVTGPAFEIELVAPADATDLAAADAQRLELSDRTRAKKLLAFVEIGPKIVEPNLGEVLRLATPATAPAGGGTSGSAAAMGGPDVAAAQNLMAQLQNLPAESQIRYYTSQPTLQVFRTWLQQTLSQPVMTQRFGKLGLDAAQFTKAIGALYPPVMVVDRGMARRAADGSVTYEANNANIIVNTMVPTILVALMFVAVMVGASPLATNIVEEKQLRIAEVLLGGLTPFQLMLGKLLGGAGVSVTLAAIYFAGLFFAARQFDLLQYVRVETMLWFVLFTLVGVMMYGSLFVAAGAAVTNLKEAQTTLTPVMIVVAMPFFVLMPIVQYPNGVLSRVTSYVPLTAPSVGIIRAAIPNGATRWELALSAVAAIAGMLAVIWIAGRIFRAGMLLTSKPASVREAIGWVLRG